MSLGMKKHAGAGAARLETTEGRKKESRGRSERR